MNPTDHVAGDGRDHSIIDILERPVVVFADTWSTGSAANTTILGISVIDDMLKIPMWTRKLTNFRYFKADVEYTILVNAQPFQQGGLLVHYLPPADISDGPTYASLPMRTSQYSKVLNLAEPSPITFRIPYSHPMPYYDLCATATNRDPNHFGQFYLTVYSPLTMANVNITVLARFCNISLKMPAFSTIYVPQVGGLCDHCDESHTVDSASQRDLDIIRKYQDGTVRGVIARLFPDDLQPQTGASSGVVAKPSARTGVDQTQEAANLAASQGTQTSSQGSFLSTVGNFFAKVASVAGVARMLAIPASWAVKFLAGGLSAFGWSKPLLVAPPTFVKHRAVRAMQNSDTVDTSENLGILSENSITSKSFLSDNLDEMHFDNIITNFVYSSSFTWSTSNAVGTVLYDVYVAPRACDSTSPIIDGPAGALEYKTTYLGYVSSFFEMWRGDIRYQLRAFKTCFHSGRLAIVWDPGFTSFAAADNTILGQAYSIIWDLRTQHTTVVTIPYASNLPWIQNPFWGIGDSPDYSKYCNGRLRIIVQNPLVANAVASQSVSIAVEIAGAPGFQFAVPGKTGLNPFINNSSTVNQYKKPLWIPPATSTRAVKSTEVEPIEENDNASNASLETQDDGVTDDEIDSPYVPQVGDDSSVTIEESYITKDIPKTNLVLLAEHTTGEMIVSFRQLLKAYSNWPLRTDSTLPAVNAKWTSITNPVKCALLRVFPWVMRRKPLVQTFQPGVDFVTTPSVDRVDAVASMFNFYRGSMRLKILQTRVGWGTLVAAIENLAHTNFPVDNLDLLLAQTNAAIFDGQEGVVEVQIPFYSNLPYAKIEPDTTSSDLTKNVQKNVLYYNSTNESHEFHAGSVIMFRAIGDDFSFHFLRSLPRLQCVSLINNVWPAG